MNMLGHISNTLSNHPTPFEDTNYDYTIYGVLSKIEKMLLRGFDLETIRKKKEKREVIGMLLMKHTNEPLLIQEILMSLYLELLDDYTIYGILEKRKCSKRVLNLRNNRVGVQGWPHAYFYSCRQPTTKPLFI